MAGNAAEHEAARKQREVERRLRESPGSLRLDGDLECGAGAAKPPNHIPFREALCLFCLWCYSRCAGCLGHGFQWMLRL